MPSFARKLTKKTIFIGLGIMLATAIALAIIVSLAFPEFTRGVKRFASRELVELSDKWYDRQVSEDDMAIESAEERASLPEYKVVPAISAENLTESGTNLSNYQNWLRSSGDDGAARYSSLGQIRPSNVKDLKVAWSHDKGGESQIQATPVFTGKTLIVLDGRQRILGLDPASGEEKWSYEPQGALPARRGFLLLAPSNGGAKTLFFTAGSKLYALDPETGKRSGALGDGEAQLTGPGSVAPALCNGKVIVPVTEPQPGMQIIDLKTGDSDALVKFMPDDLPTGTGGRPSRQTGGNAWSGFSLDSERCIAFFALGNPSPVLVGVERRGDNPGSNSIVAVSIDEQKVLWEFQEIAHDLWDLDTGSSPVLTSIAFKGRRVDIVAAVTKAGNTLILDRLSGEPLFDWRLRRALVSDVPGERSAPYQPDPLLPEPFSRRTFSAEDVTDIGKENRASVLAQLTGMKFGFYQAPSPTRPLAMYGLHGGASWKGPAIDPKAGALFVAGNNVPSILSLLPVTEQKLDNSLPGRAIYIASCAACHGADLSGGSAPSLVGIRSSISQEKISGIINNGYGAMPAISGINDQDIAAVTVYLKSGSGGGVSTQRFVRGPYRRLYDLEGYPGAKGPWGTLTRLNLSTGKIVWQVPLGRAFELEARGIIGTGTENTGGPTVTAGGLVFVSGTKDQMIHAFNSSNGERIWSYELPHIGSAPPMTYQYRGEQYVVVPATGGGMLKLYDDRITTGGAIVAFKLRNSN